MIVKNNNNRETNATYKTTTKMCSAENLNLFLRAPMQRFTKPGNLDKDKASA